ncbi:LON peptidase substrate-binding domain-containing protein [Prochlorococcus sp. MIT 1300]|uniref:LON peptidase substrate-binding domain-containing protein n=1 Tax=Prochlorococcus sp. MIT 1300 TaxID=3096218 RepID=UPI002A74A2F7|nr:LON peptidase substrate-binding domain-containing protein [Prochlorococcus sp. MIT 1300]
MTDISVRELPLFPLPDLVLFPQEVLPLHIFESRYRIMLQTVLEGDGRFGVLRWDPEKKTMAEVGCCAEVVQHHTSEDGRSYIVTIGQQRFRTLDLIRKTPFLTAMVTWIEDEEITDQEALSKLAIQVESSLRDVVGLTAKLTDSEMFLPDDLPDLPRELSFWVAAHLDGPVSDLQQLLLQSTDTKGRLQRELEMLDHTKRQLAARTALKDTFSNVDQANS